MLVDKYSKNIKFLRKHIKSNQAELGEILGVTKTTISDWENGKLKYMTDDKAMHYYNRLREHPNFPEWITLDKFLNNNLEEIAHQCEIGKGFFEMAKASKVKFSDYHESPPRNERAISLPEFLSNPELQGYKPVEADEAGVLERVFADPFIRYKPEVYYGALLMYRKLKELEK